MWEVRQPPKSRKRRESHTGLIQGGIHRDTVIKLTKIKDTQKILKPTREK